jgi:hypothetical protein
MNLLIFGSIAGFWIVGLVVMLVELRKAQEGCENEDGFHYARRPSAPRATLHGVLHHGGV